MIDTIRKRVADERLEDVILFHGTSERALEGIAIEGMEAIECSHAFPPDDRDEEQCGTFWFHRHRRHLCRRYSRRKA
jgi:hypothetical protein